MVSCLDSSFFRVRDCEGEGDGERGISGEELKTGQV
jgi:hypothetical protein